MRFDLESYLTLARDSIQRPTEAAARLLAFNLSDDVRWLGLGVVVTSSAVLAFLVGLLFPVPVETPWGWLTGSPLLMAGVQAGLLVLVALAMAQVGQMFEGKGRFRDALLLVVWIETILLGVQIVQVVMMMFFPLIASLLGVVAVGLFFWLLAQFTKALHGFRHLGLVALGMAGTMVLTAIALSALLGALGLLPPMPDAAM